MPKKYDSAVIHSFFARSSFIDYMVLRPLSHIAPNWEARWDGDEYAPEHDSFAEDLNAVISQIAQCKRPYKYHDNEDKIVEMLINSLGWPVQKKNGKWIGANYAHMLEQGAFRDIGQKNLISAATGRVQAALDFGQNHFDDMEDGHLTMLAALMTIIIYHRETEGTSLINRGGDQD